MYTTIMKTISLLEKFFLAIFTLLSLAIAGVAVFFRYFLDSALSWPEEITGFILIGITVFGSSLAFKTKQHATVNLISRFLSSTSNSFLSLIIQLVSLFISFMVTILAVKMEIDLYQTDQYCTALEYLPIWLPMLIFPIGFIFINLRCFELFLDKIRETLG